MIIRRQVFEVTIELGNGTFVWNRHIIGYPTKSKVLILLEKEIEESRQHELNGLGSPTLVELHQRYYDLVNDFGMPEGTQCECESYGTRVGMIYVILSSEVIQIEET